MIQYYYKRTFWTIFSLNIMAVWEEEEEGGSLVSTFSIYLRWDENNNFVEENCVCLPGALLIILCILSES